MNSVVSTLRVQDRDVGDNGRLQFSVVSGDSSAFSLQERQLSDGWWEVDILSQIVSQAPHVRCTACRVQSAECGVPDDAVKCTDTYLHFYMVTT